MIDENFYNYFGSRLKVLRKTNKITQVELSDHLGINPTTLVNYENGNRKIPLDVATRIAAFFNVGLDSITAGYCNQNEALKSWNSEFCDIVFDPEEIDELINYGKYILYKRNDKVGKN